MKMERSSNDGGSLDNASSPEKDNEDNKESKSATVKQEQQETNPTDKQENNKNKEKEEENKKGSTEKDEKAKEQEEREQQEQERLRREERKKKYANWPLKDIKEPHENDVMYGRGGGTNHHPGNKRYRKMVEERKLDYVNSKRLDKPLVALEIIRQWRDQEPPGRFLKLNERTGLWSDVGDKKAREKTSQALREKAPEIRRKQEEEAMAKARAEQGDKGMDEKRTRFASDTKDVNRGSRPALTRDHSLGREYLRPGEAIGIDGFAWDAGRMHGYGSVSGGYAHSSTGSMSSSGGYPPSRQGSGMGPPPDYYHHPPPHHHPPMPPPPDGGPYPRYDSWSSRPHSGGHHTPPPPPSMPMYSPSGSFDGHHPSTYAASGGPGPGPGPISREHSLSHNPLRDASVGASADRHSFDRGSGYWGGGPPPPPPPVPPQPHAHLQQQQQQPQNTSSGGSSPRSVSSVGASGSGGGRYMSGGGEYTRAPAYDPNRPPMSPSERAAKQQRPPFNMDQTVAHSWSDPSPREDFEKAATLFSTRNESGRARLATNHDSSPITRAKSASPAEGLPRPDMVKRMTSNQNEDYETKRNLKRATLSRDSSAAAARLKEIQFPHAPKKPFLPEQEMNLLSNTMEQSSLGQQGSCGSGAKPLPVERTSTIDKIAMDIMSSKPMTLDGNGRMSTVEALVELDLGVERGSMNRDQSAGSILLNSNNINNTLSSRGKLTRPQSLRFDGRLSTAEYMDIVNEPLGLDEVDVTHSNPAQQPQPMDLNREASVSEWLRQG